MATSQFHRGRGRGRGGQPMSQPNRPLKYYYPTQTTPDPDMKITNAEDRLVDGKNSLDQRLAALNVHEKFPSRPNYGNRGPARVLRANYVPLSFPPDIKFCRHELSISPEAKGRKLARIIELFLEQQKLTSITDYASTLYTGGPLQDGVFPIKYRAEHESAPREGATTYKITRTFKGTLDVGQFVQNLASTTSDDTYAQKSAAIIQALNVLMNYVAKSRDYLICVGASKRFFKSIGDSFDFGDGLIARRGYFTSVRMATARILLNVNISHAAFHQEKSLITFIKRFISGHDPAQLPTYNTAQLAQHLNRLRVKVTRSLNKDEKSAMIPNYKTIYGLADPKDGRQLTKPPMVAVGKLGPTEVKFWLVKEGKYISVYDYFLNRYGLRLNETKLPVVNVGTKANPTYLPPELCEILPHQVVRYKLSPQQTTKMIQFAVRSPNDNASSIVLEGLRMVGVDEKDPAPLLKNLNIGGQSQLITIKGRVLGAPELVYQQNKRTQATNGSWAMHKPPLKFRNGMQLDTWQVLYIKVRNVLDDKTLWGIMESLSKALKRTGITVADPKPPQTVSWVGTKDPNLHRHIKAAAASLDLLFVVMPNDHQPLVYQHIKTLADVEYGVRTICCLDTKIARCDPAYLGNLALKVNLKLGGDNYHFTPSSLDVISGNTTMVVGIDVTHPSPGSSSMAPSVAGMVASINWKLAQWPGTLSVQQGSKELVSDLKSMLMSRLKVWQKNNNGALPENILVYRDGVSEGQYDGVLKEEMPQLRDACRQVYPAARRDKVCFTLVVVTKRHHTRFYATKKHEADNSGNPFAGTVVDRGVTEACHWDFFLQSHAALQGTARPAHYFVLLNEIFVPRQGNGAMAGETLADRLQTLTLSLCYAFGRATKAVSYCAPAYYADVLCERARCYLYHVFDASAASGPGAATLQEQQTRVGIHDKLKDTMFYI